MKNDKDEPQKSTAEEVREKLKGTRRALPYLNFRPFLYLALGLVFGIVVYTRCRFGGAKGTDFIFFVLLLAFSIRPLSLKRTGTIFLCFILSASVGAGLIHLKYQSFSSGIEGGEYGVTGVVTSFTCDDNGTTLILDDITLNGASAGGKLSVTVSSQSVRTGDKLEMRAVVSPNGFSPAGSSYGESLFVKDIRYFASVVGEQPTVTGKGNYLLRLNAAVYEVFHENLPSTQADTAYALLTGNAGNIDEGFASAVRQGGVAHIFAVSGLHIGILYGAVSFALKKLGRYRVIPSLAAVVLYAAFCGFSVSSVRAVIMCAVLGIYGATGRKYDFLGATSFAATLVLLFRPAEWFSAGFRLSFGACLGLALYARPLRRAFRKLPRFLGNYLAANLSVQLFTFPVLFETFGYFSVWGTALNLILIPALPVLFLGLFLSALFSLVIPPAAAVFLSVPNGMLSLFLWLFSFDFSLALAGFSLGAGGAVWTIGSVALSERVNFKAKTKAFLAIGFSVLFMSILVLRNAVFTGCKFIVAKGIVLIQTRTEHILVVDGNRNAQTYQNFLMRNYGGELDAVIVLNENAAKGLSASLTLPARELRAARAQATGISEKPVLYDGEFEYGKVKFHFIRQDKLIVTVEGKTAEIDFSGKESIQADLFVSGEREERIYFRNKTITRSS